MKKIIKEINEKKNLDVNLPEYGKYMMNLYNKKAVIELTMDYYTIFEMLSDGEYNDDKLQHMVDKFNEILKATISSDISEIERASLLDDIDELRDNIYKTVDILSAYADIFSRYEYVSNRCEYLFKEPELNINDEELTKEVMNYIFCDEDNSVINSKISEIVAELPLRMTKSKFFELLDNGLSVYSKTDKETIDDFVYLLKSSAMLILPENMEEYEELNEIYNEVKSLDFKNITAEEFKKLEDSLRYVTDLIDKETNIFMMLQGIVNRVYVMIIASSYVDYLSDDKELSMCMDIIRAINDNFIEGEYISLPDDVTDLFVFLEGSPEEILNKIQSVEYALDTVKNNYLSIIDEFSVNTLYKELFVSSSLLSDSLFIDLTDLWNMFNNDEENDTEEFDIQKYVEKVRDEMIITLTEFFENNQKIVNKSVMALILSRLPVFFNNITEIQDYVYNSLSNCTNKAEKYAVAEILNCIVNEN